MKRILHVLANTSRSCAIFQSCVCTHRLQESFRFAGIAHPHYFGRANWANRSAVSRIYTTSSAIDCTGHAGYEKQTLDKINRQV